MKVIKIKKDNGLDDPGFLGIIILLVILIIGIIFILPPLLGVVSFIGNIFGADDRFFTLWYLSSNWTGGDNAMSAAPLYLGLMAIAGAFFIIGAIALWFYVLRTIEGIDSIHSIEIEEKEKEDTK